MIEWKTYLDATEYDPPEGLERIVLAIKRDEQYHGIFFEASINTLTFTGAAANYILEKKRVEGIVANIIFAADIRCNAYEEFENLITGKLNISKAVEQCGDVCSVEVPIEQENCVSLLLNRFDQKVDLDSLISFDKVTALEPYTFAGFSMDVLSKALKVGATGYVADTGDRIDWSIYVETGGGPILPVLDWVRPDYQNKKDETIVTTNLEPTVFAADDTGLADSILTPQVLLEDESIDCFSGAFTYSARMKGRVNNLHNVAYVRAVLLKGALPETIEFPLDVTNPDILTAGMEILQDTILLDEFSVDVSFEFDVAFTGSTTLAMGQGLYNYIQVAEFSRQVDDGRYIEFDKETFIDVQAVRECPDTEAKVYMINEALSRIVEAITNACLKVRSDYYGRTDSQPYAAAADGCGSMKAINSGLQLRNAPDAKAFVSFKEALEGLNPIDNIGFGLEPDPDRPGFDQLRIEDVKYWYPEEEILRLTFAPDVKKAAESDKYYAKINVGYQKWEVEKVNGLDEVNANRQYRTSLTSVDNTLDILSKWVAGSYPIEVTRQQTYASSGAADTKYDNETFVYCMERLLYGFRIEQGNVTNGTNMFSPATLYNWRIRPYYNLMRWFKTIAAGYPSIGDTEKKVFFNSGTGNYLASGEMTSFVCKLENGEKAENDDLGVNDFVGDDYHPIWRPERVTLKYPMSVGEYKSIKAAPRGYITVQCGVSDQFIKGYIMMLEYFPDKGEANFNLKLKWE